MADLTPEQQAALDAENAKKAAAAEAAVPALQIPVPPKGADYDAIATIHQNLVAEGQHEVAAAFHKKHVLGFKALK